MSRKDGYVSGYLRQPLRSYEEALRERARRPDTSPEIERPNGLSERPAFSKHRIRQRPRSGEREP